MANKAGAKAAPKASPSRGAVVGAATFWAVAAVLSLITIAASQLPDWVWVLRGVMLVVGGGVVFGSLWRESYRKHHGLDADRIPGIFDRWTIVHTTAGLVMGAWGVPLPLVALFTIGWEIFEYKVPGFGDTEIIVNRTMDIAVALVGWVLVAGIVALGLQTAIPWLLPSLQSILRDAGLHLF